MKTKLKHLLFLAIIVTALVCLTALAASATCQLNGSGSYTFADAYTDASNGDTITITADETISSSMTISKNLTITSSTGAEKLIVGGSAMVTIGSTVTFDTAYVSCQTTSAKAFDLTSSANVTLTNCTFGSHTAPSGAPRMFSTTGAAKMTINSGTYYVVPYASGDSRFINMGGTNASGYVKIKGGTFIDDQAKTRCIIRPYGAAPVTISGGVFNVKNQVVFAESYTGTITVNTDDTTNVTVGGKTYATPYFYCTTAGNTVHLFDLNMAGTLNITGGTFQSVRTIIRPRNKDATINISGGTFTSTDTASTSAVIYAEKGGNNTNTSKKITITGGTMTATNYVIFLGYITDIDIKGTASLTTTGTNKAVILSNSGTSTISIGGSAIVRNTNTSTTQPTIDLFSAATLNVTGGTITASSSSAPAILGRAANYNVIISGGEITSAYAGTSDAFVSAVFKFTYLPKTFTISGGTFRSTGNYAAVFQPEVAGITLTINANTSTPVFSSAWRIFNLYKNNSILNISGGTFTSSTTGEHFVWQNASGCATTIEGGTFGSTSLSTSGTIVGGSAGTINISGGDFRNGHSRIVFTSGANLNVTGGTFVTTKSDGYDVFDFSGNANSTYTVNISGISVSGVSGVFRYRSGATINIKSGTFTATYAVFDFYNSDAVGTVTLGGTSDTLTMSATGTAYVLYAKSGTNARGTVVINNNANLLSESRVINFTSGTNITINDGAYLQSGANGEGIAIWNNGTSAYNDTTVKATITMNGGTITGVTTNGGAVTGTYRGIGTSAGATVAMHGGTIVVRQGGSGVALYTVATTFTMDGGEIDASQGTGSCVYIPGAGSTFTMTDGTLTAGSGRCINVSAASTITVSGGEMNTQNYLMYLNAATTVVIEGDATLTSTSTTNPAIYTVLDAAASTITVRSKVVDEVTYSPTLSLTAASNHWQIFYISNASTLNISAGTFSVSNGAVFYVNYAGATLNITGGDFTSAYAGASDAYVSAIFDITALPASFTITGGNFTTTGNYACVWYNTLANANITIDAADPEDPPTFTSSWRMFQFDAVTTFTMNAGELTANNCVIYTNAACTVDLNGGTIISTADSNYPCVAAYGAPTITIDGATIQATSARAVQLSSAGKVEMKSGTIDVGSFGLWSTAGAKGEIIVSGGSITSTRGVGSSVGSKVTVTGGEFYAPTAGQCVFFEGTAPTDDIVISGATMTSKNYVIYLKTNVNLVINSGSYTSTNSFVIYTADCSPTITLNGGTFTTEKDGTDFAVIKTDASSTYLAVEGHKRIDFTPVITVNGATLNAIKTSTRGILLCTGGSVTMNSGSVTAGNIGIWSNGGVGAITVNGGMISASRGIGTSTGSAITVTGGTISGIVHSALLVEGSDATTINITGGTFTTTGNSPAISITNTNASTKLTIKNGTFSPYAGQRAVDTRAAADIYGGLFTASNDVIQAGSKSSSCTLNIYGGYFVSTVSNSTLTTNIRLGTSDTTVTHVANIYGGVYTCTNTTGRHVFFEAAHPTNATINLYSYVCSGNAVVFQQGEGSAEVVSATIRHVPGTSSTSYNNISALSGASIRLNDEHPGIRFTSTVSEGFITRLEGSKKVNTDISYGTLIVPVDYLSGISFTEEALKAAGKAYLKITANAGITEEDDGSLTIRASMIDIKPGNVNRKFAAILFADYIDSEGVARRCYGNYVEKDNARSVADVAQIALNDVRDEQEGEYLNRWNGRYTRYSERQREILKSFGASFTEKAVDIYIIAGQSNGSGYSTMTSAFQTAHAGETYEHVLFSGGAGCAYAGATQYSETNLAPVSTGFGGDYTASRIGAEFGMAAVLSQYYMGDDYTGTEGTVNRDACIVKWAEGGTHLMDPFGLGSDTSLSDWRTGSWTPPSYIEEYGANNETLSGAQYYILLSKVQNAIAQMRKEGYNQFNVKGVFWMQGEAERNVTKVRVGGANVTVDMCSFSSPYSYPALFSTLVSDLRTDLGAITGENLSDLTFVIGEISDSFGRTHTANQTNFVAMQNEMAARFDNVYTIGNTKLAVGYRDSDNAHWTADDMLLIGKMVGTKMLNAACGQSLNDNPAITTADADDAIVSVTASGVTTYYNHLPYALNYAPAGSTVTLLKNITMNSAINIANQNAFTFDGNDKTITSYSADTALRFVGTNITIEDLTVTHASANVNSTCFFESAVVNATNFAWVKTSGGITMKDSGGTTLYSNVANFEWAIATYPEGGILDLGENISVDKAYYLTKDITINGNGYTITETNTVTLFTISGTAVFNNLNVTHAATGQTSAKNYNYYITYQYADSSLTVNGGTYAGNYWCFVVNNARATLKLDDGVTASTKNAGSANYAVIMSNAAGAVVNVENSTIRQGGVKGACIHLNDSTVSLNVDSDTTFVLPTDTTNSAIYYKTGATVNVPLDDATIKVSKNGGSTSAQIVAGDIVSHS